MTRQLKGILIDNEPGTVEVHVNIFEALKETNNFPLWKEIVEGNKCGICVNPLNPREIAKAVEYLMEHSELRKQMDENGRKVVEEKYNWELQEEKLIGLYKELEKYNQCFVAS